jgi:hypothetical protein
MLTGPVLMEEVPPALEKITGVLVGQLVGFQDGEVPLVVYPGQPGTAAIAARAAVELRAEHIGDEVVLQFENCDPWKPLVMGRLRKPSAWPLADKPAQVEVDADGERLVIDAKEQIVLRCGKSSITLTKAGKVLIQGAYLLSRSSGVNRIKGGSVQIN